MAGKASSVDVETLGVRIKKLRQERKLSQDRLAIEAHVDQSGLSKFERGSDTKRTFGDAAIRRIAAVLRISFEELISATDYKVQ
jgi:transcriptional regulator with XRE-family HTH domain